MSLDNEPGDTGNELGFDLGASIDAIASELGGKGDEIEPSTDTGLDDAVPSETGEAPQAAAPANTQGAPAIRSAPKSWAKEQHERWGKLDKDTQDYIELREKQFLDGLDQYKGDAVYAKQLREVITPYSQYLQSQGVSEPQAVQYLLNAHYQLTTGTPEQRAKIYQQLGKDLGIGQSNQGQADENNPLMDLQKKVQELESQEQARQRSSVQERRQKADLETSTFASDPANVHFRDVANDMVPLVKAGMSLKDAYDTAVLKNPVTRQKELDRLSTEAQLKNAEKAKAEAEAAKRAASTNVRGARTQTAPTEPKGSMEDTMHETLKKIRARSS